MIELLKNMIDNVRDYGLEKVFRRYYSFYRAQVVSNEDEEKRGRIQVKMPQLFGDDPLPNWVEPKEFSGASKGKGHFNPPEVDDWVYVEFEGGDQRYPVYSGGWYGEEELSEEFAYVDGLPTQRGWVNKYGHVFKFVETPGKEQIILSTPSGHFLVLDDTAGKEGMFFIHKTGAQLQMDKDGSTKMVAKDGTFLNLDAVGGAATLTAKSGAYATIKDDGVTLSDPSGKSFVSITPDGVTVNTSADTIVQAKSLAVTAGSVAMDGGKAKLSLSQGKVAMGGPAAELVDQLIQALDAFINAPSLATCGTGPTSGLMPPALTQLIQIKTLLTTIKGSLP